MKISIDDFVSVEASEIPNRYRVTCWSVDGEPYPVVDNMTLPAAETVAGNIRAAVTSWEDE